VVLAWWGESEVIVKTSHAVDLLFAEVKFVSQPSDSLARYISEAFLDFLKRGNNLLSQVRTRKVLHVLGFVGSEVKNRLE
jgi:hypothetical protein